MTTLPWLRAYSWRPTFPRWARWSLVACVVGPLLGTGAASFDDRQPPIAPNTIQGSLDSQEVRPGGRLEGVWTFLAIKGCPATAHRWLTVEDARGKVLWRLPLPELYFDLDDYGPDFPKQVSLPITPIQLPASPDAAPPPGDGFYNRVDEYRCNHFGHYFVPVIVNFRSLRFRVLPPS